MSDFDKEAERKRLREKYEHDEQKREVTERMSELLLKGATMTNAHCQDCGDPIFRYDGQEFCATCQQAVQRDADEGAESEADDADAATNGDREEIHVAAPDRETSVQFGGDDQPADATGPEAPSPDESPEPAQNDQSPESARADESPVQPARSQVSRRPESADQGEDGDLAAAAAALSREITRLARHAETTDDLGQKRALYDATQEAAEALEAVQEASR